jgi:hypothetical protein
MGYTHYYRTNREVPLKLWKRIVKKCEAIIAKADCPLVFECDVDEPPALTDEFIRFNGKGNDGHETFYLSRVPVDSFNFCKTARKPYDDYVVECLKACKQVAPSYFELSSDGDYEDGGKIFG